MPVIYLFIRYPFENRESIVLFTTREIWCELGKQELYFPGIYNLLAEGRQQQQIINLLTKGQCYRVASAMPKQNEGTGTGVTAKGRSVI